MECERTPSPPTRRSARPPAAGGFAGPCHLPNPYYGGSHHPLPSPLDRHSGTSGHPVGAGVLPPCDPPVNPARSSSDPADFHRYRDLGYGSEPGAPRLGKY
ncbi:hypothetical protein PVAP13_5NG012676 [Panicum virgatum]|uniref:Uncharacterized protein n=1 Tax=Panicum virgatum TaxID=38727 RepID=A0A8T0SBT6_PANVG|nr:hypothetical protein PVAP13_5NG012676 [Panicum virgatum]